jgi:hypothetical protein
MIMGAKGVYYYVVHNKLLFVDNFNWCDKDSIGVLTLGIPWSYSSNTVIECGEYTKTDNLQYRTAPNNKG